MKIICISDTHNFSPDQWKHAIPDGDVLVHAGDATGIGEIHEVTRFLTWFSKQPHKHKVFVAGNHDLLFENHPDEAERLLHAFPSITYLQDSGAVLDGVNFWGSPWQPEFGGWGFNLPRGEKLAEKWALIPDNIDVLVTHGPPRGIGDTVNVNAFFPDYPIRRAGCADLLKALERAKPKVHVFGHIHSSHGRHFKAPPFFTQFVNACICTEEYRPENFPIVVDL